MITDTEKKTNLYIPFRWEERRHVFLDRFFYVPKKYESSKNSEPVLWASPQVFGNDAPVCVEFCSGNGQWILEQAQMNPQQNWVAIEMRFERARQIWMGAQREELSNVYVVCAEALEFIRYYVPPKCVTQCFVNFPDPWPKRQHAKHRLVQAPFVTTLQSILQPGASVTLTTDSAPYRDQMLSEFAAWRSEFPSPFFSTSDSSYGDSFFANLWKKKGREIFTMRYRHAVD